MAQNLVGYDDNGDAIREDDGTGDAAATNVVQQAYDDAFGPIEYDPLKPFMGLGDNQTVADAWLAQLQDPANPMNTAGWFNPDGSLTTEGEAATSSDRFNTMMQGANFGGITAAANRLLGLGGPTGMGAGALTSRDLGLGSTAMLGILGALTDKPKKTTKTETVDQTSSGTTSGTTSQQQTGTSSQQQTGTSSQQQTGTSSQQQTGTSSQQQTGTSSQQQTGTSSQQQTGTSSQQQTGTQTGTSSQTQTGAQTGTSSQTQTGAQTGTSSQTQTGAQTGTTETTLPQWYLDLVKEQAAGVGDLDKYQAFQNDLLNLGGGKKIVDYMNPYLESAMNPVMRKLKEDQALEQQQFDAQRVARGGFGSARADLLANQLQGRQQQVAADTLSQAYNQAFGQAQGMARADLDRMYQDWQLQQMDPRNLAQTQSNILTTLKPGQITNTTGTTTGTTLGQTAGTTTGTTLGQTAGTTTGTTTGQTSGTTTGTTTGTTSGTTTGQTAGTTTGTTAGTTTGQTAGTTTGQTAGTTTGQTAGTTTGQTAGTATGTTAGTTTGAINSALNQSVVGADPNMLTQLAGVAGALTSLTNPVR